LTFNQFFPWQINEDGSAEETVNHVGRHELGGSYRAAAFNDDPNLEDLYDFAVKYNTNIISNFLQIRESPVTPGLFYGVDAPEFSTHAAGQIVTLTGSTNINPDLMRLAYLTPRSTANDTNYSVPLPTDHTGLYRNPLPMTDGTLVCSHTATKSADLNAGTVAFPVSLYDFRLKTLRFTNGFYVPDQFLTPGISNSVTWYDPDTLVTYSNTVLWELDPVEVWPRPVPARRVESIDPIELSVFAEEGVAVRDMRNYLTANNLALIISRNVTTRDHADKQQPYNLHVPGGIQTLGAAGKIYDVQYFELYQADQIRGLGITQPGLAPRAGRRVLAQDLHDPVVDNPALDTNAPPGSIVIAGDGSVAAFVPARRATTWQLTDPTGGSVVKERYWITFQPGEIRTCTSCHGVNTYDQSGQPPATNSPASLHALLSYWKSQYRPVVEVQTDAGTNYLAIEFNRRLAATNLTHTVELSDELFNWVSGSTYGLSGDTPNTPFSTEVRRSGSINETIVVRDNSPLGTLTNRFMRVRVRAQ